MARFEDMKQHVVELYNAKDPGRNDWADWFIDNHVMLVTDNAKRLAEKYGANVELAQVAALLHDVADVHMKRRNPAHEEESLELARQLMQEFGYTADEIALVVDDAIRYHSCKDNQRPKSTEGLVLSTADSLAHLKTDFYVYAAWAIGKEDSSLEQVKDWVLKKIERDFRDKISFEDERRDATPDYELIKSLFSR